MKQPLRLRLIVDQGVNMFIFGKILTTSTFVYQGEMLTKLKGDRGLFVTGDNKGKIIPIEGSQGIHMPGFTRKRK